MFFDPPLQPYPGTTKPPDNFERISIDMDNYTIPENCISVTCGQVAQARPSVVTRGVSLYETESTRDRRSSDLSSLLSRPFGLNGHCAGKRGKLSGGFRKVLFPNSYENLSSCWISSSRPQVFDQFSYRYREWAFTPSVNIYPTSPKKSNL